MTAGDAGSKASGRRTQLPVVVRPVSWQGTGLSAGHPYLARDGGELLQIGDRIELIPHYSGSTVLSNRTIYACRDGQVVEEWPIAHLPVRSNN